MSSPEKSDGIHPPAVKAGGMRIVQNKGHLKEKKPDGNAVPKPEEADVLNVSTSPPKSVTTQISGALKHGDADFTKEAVKSFHEKPVPTHENKAVQSRPMIIQQPRK